MALDFLLGKPSQLKQLPVYGQPQTQLINQAAQNAQSLLGQTAQGFEPFAQKARQQFETQTIPGLAERFTALGGGQRSSAFQGALGQAGAGLESDLAMLGSNYNNQLLNTLLSTGLRPTFENYYQPGQQGFLQSGASSAAQGLSSILPLLLLLTGGGASGGLGSLLSLLGRR